MKNIINEFKNRILSFLPGRASNFGSITPEESAAREKDPGLNKFYEDLFKRLDIKQN